MKMVDIFSTIDPKCLFCKESIIILSNKVTNYEPEYYCSECQELFIPFNNNKRLYFTIFDISVIFDFTKQIMFIKKKNVENPVLPPGLPIVELDFSNRYKLVKRLKTYMTFS
jgi:hypothetical protein